MRVVLTFLAFIFYAASTPAAETGFVKIELKPAEFLGEQGAASVADVLPGDEPVVWRLYVPDSYDPVKPPGAFVFVGTRDWGGVPKRWIQSMSDSNLIWISANDAGATYPLDERMLKAMLAPVALKQRYVVEPGRIYIAGYKSGGSIATMLQTSKPELFRGGIYFAESVAWKKTPPPKLELMKQNHHAFVVGTADNNVKKMRRIHRKYKDAGIENAELILIRDFGDYFPPADVLEEAIEHLDSRLAR